MRSLPRLLLRIALIAIAVTALGIATGRALIGALLPFLSFVAEGLSADYSALLSWDPVDHAMLLIKAQFLNPTSGLAALGIELGQQVTAGTHLHHVLVPPVLLYIFLCAWPVSNIKQRLFLLLAGVPAALLALALTTPFLLAGKIEGMLQDHAAAAGVARPQSPVLTWMLFTEGGARWLLPIVLALICIALMHAFLDPRAAPQKRPLTWDEFKQNQ